MSTGERVPLKVARGLAQEVTSLLEPEVGRSAIVGSLRRGRPTVGDIELLVEPRQSAGLLYASPVGDELDRVVRDFIEIGTFSIRPPRRLGSAYKALVYRGVALDLFICRPPASWGVLTFIRTGPAEWNLRVVSECRERGFRFEGGQLWRGSEPLDTPTEEDVFVALGLAYIPPAERSARAVRWEAQA